MEPLTPIDAGKKCMILSTNVIDSIIPINPKRTYATEDDIIQLAERADIMMVGEKMTMQGRETVFMFGIGGSWIKANTKMMTRRIEDVLKKNGC